MVASLGVDPGLPLKWMILMVPSPRDDLGAASKMSDSSGV